ncbi:6-phosphofructokinase 2 [Platanthera guangdongensis]|uniref:6-phosphofructokinase 2 n=1 Tax=Platanthera guangdongensis TaxID=2320717 RepID=A0ABR2M0A0_9ASPA
MPQIKMEESPLFPIATAFAAFPPNSASFGRAFRAAFGRNSVAGLQNKRMADLIRELVIALWDLYGVRRIFGVQAGFRGFYSCETVELNPRIVHDWHLRGGTSLATSRGGFDLDKIVGGIGEKGFNQMNRLAPSRTVPHVLQGIAHGQLEGSGIFFRRQPRPWRGSVSQAVEVVLSSIALSLNNRLGMTRHMPCYLQWYLYRLRLHLVRRLKRIFGINAAARRITKRPAAAFAAFEPDVP